MKGTWLRSLLPPALLLLGALAAWALAQGRPLPVSEREPPAPPLVRVSRPAPGPVQLKVRTHGTVTPRTESDLVAEVSGRVTWRSPAFVEGGFFESGERLFQIDRRDYDNAVRRARAGLARAESEVRLAEAELARARSLAQRAVTSASLLDRQRSAREVAIALRDESRAALDQALRDLERTDVRAPFEGRVRLKQIDVGQFVTRGQPAARLYAIDFAEVRLPVHDADLAHLELPERSRDAPSATPEGPPVRLRGRVAGRLHEWTGSIVRSEGEIDASSRMLHLVARVEDPYGRREGRPPLPVGLFVDAEIQGRTLTDVLSVPRSALDDSGRIAVVDAQQRLRLRRAEVLRYDGDRALLRARLSDGEGLCLSRLPVAIDGMPVRPLLAPDEAGPLAIAKGPR
jgi:RND family efflux transporter MFP subunit